MKISLAWAQQYSPVRLVQNGVDELVAKIGAQLGAVEEVISLEEKYDRLVLVKVVSCVKHPKADKLHVCLIDDGGAITNAVRNNDGLVEVVCGAPNVREGITVVWCPPGSTVPSTFGTKDPFVLSARELRGIVSNGMLSSPRELGIGESHEGLLLIDHDEFSGTAIEPGMPFKKLLELEDTIVDVENKMFTHRPDCFGILGVAREIAGIQSLKFTSPDWYLGVPQLNAEQSGNLPIEVANDASDLVPRFMAATITGISHASAPLAMQADLSRVGLRPISNIVDITNYMMYLTAQPLHAFDYDKLLRVGNGTVKLGPRMAKKGEKLKLLGGKEIELTEEDIVIANGGTAVALAGIMGGADTEVDETTVNIVVECATFDMYAVRRSSMRHGLFTDAVARFNKGQSPLQNDRVLAKTIEYIQNIAGGKLEAVYDIKTESVAPYPAVETTVSFINDRLGDQLDVEKIITLLENVEFHVEQIGDTLRITPPFWRTDIAIPEDIVEEVGRLYGYDSLPVGLPMRTISPVSKNRTIEFMNKVRGVLSEAGANEVLTYSFVHDSLLEKAGQKTESAFHLRNALSPDLHAYRVSLLPSLLETVHGNIKQGFDQFGIFEIGKVHIKGVADTEEQDLPGELPRLAFVFAADDKEAKRSYRGAAYYQAKFYLEYLLNKIGIRDIEYTQKISGDMQPQISQTLAAPFEEHRMSYLMSGNTLLGVIGEPKRRVRQAMKLPDFCAMFEMDVSALMDIASDRTRYVPLGKYPSVTQDLTLSVDDGHPWNAVTMLLREVLAENGHPNADISTLDIFRKSAEHSERNLTYRITMRLLTRTMTTDEANTLLDVAAQELLRRIGAKRI